MCVYVCESACVCVCVCTGADDRGHGLHTRGTANEKEAFPLTFHGSQKQFAQRKVAKQPQCYSVELRGKKKKAKTNHQDFSSSLTLMIQTMCNTLQLSRQSMTAFKNIILLRLQSRYQQLLLLHHPQLVLTHFA